MNNLLMILRYIFAILTLIGAGYIFFTGGKASPGYAVIPMLLTLITNAAYKK